MTTTNDLGGAAEDRGTGPPGPGRGAAGTTIRIDPKLVGCGCFGCSSTAVLAGCLTLAIIVGLVLLAHWRVNHSYVAGTCRVVKTRLLTQKLPAADPKVPEREAYRPEIRIRYEVKGRTFETWTYDGGVISSEDRASQQAIVDTFQVGANYPFWYDPDRPEKAVLVRGGGAVYLLLIVPIGLLVLGCVGLLIAWKIVSTKPAPAVIPSASPVVEAPPPEFGMTITRTEETVATIDTQRFGDPIAAQTGWTPLRARGGVNTANFQTLKLVEPDLDRLEFRATGCALVFALPFIAVGVFTLAIVAAGIASSRGRPSAFLLPGIALGLLFIVAGGALIYGVTTPTVFDRRSGFYWRGRKAPDELVDGKPGGDSVRLQEIHAIQVLRYGEPGGRARFTACQLNLVLNDGGRLTFAAHPDLHRARRDAAKVAEFLGKPVWDAS